MAQPHLNLGSEHSVHVVSPIARKRHPVMERWLTYGGRIHQSTSQKVEELKATIQRIIADAKPEAQGLASIEGDEPAHDASENFASLADWAADHTKFVFDDTLTSSLVYQRVAHRGEDSVSFRSSILRSHAQSVLSGINLSDVSNVGIAGVPVDNSLSRLPEVDDPYTVPKATNSTEAGQGGSNTPSEVASSLEEAPSSANVFSATDTWMEGAESYSRTSNTIHEQHARKMQAASRYADADVWSIASLGLHPKDNDQLITLFITRIVDSLPEDKVLECATDPLAELLQDYCTLLRDGHNTHGKMLQAAAFVRKRSRLIAEALQERMLPREDVRPNSSGLPSVEDKLNMLWLQQPEGTGDLTVVHLEDLDYSSIGDLDDTVFEGPIDVEDVRKALQFLTEGREFQWLLRRIKTASSLENTGNINSNVRQALTQKRGSTEMVMQWPLRRFLSSQFGNLAEVSLSSVICIVGHPTRSQATTCGEYVGLVWPEVGTELLRFLTDAVRREGKLSNLRVTQ